MAIRDFFRNRVNRMAESMDLFKKDVFELEGVPAFREYYNLFIFVWQAIYKGFYKAWHDVPVKTIRDPKGKRRGNFLKELPPYPPFKNFHSKGKALFFCLPIKVFERCRKTFYKKFSA